MKKQDILKVLEEANKVSSNLTDKQLECYSSNPDFKKGASNGGIIAGNITLNNNLGIHTEDEELRRQWSILGGHATIEQLLQWQKDNGHNIGEIAKVKDKKWVNNIKKALIKYYQENPMPPELRKQIGDKIKKNNKKLTQKQRSEKFSNDSASTKSLKIRTEILNTIENDTFITSDARKACEDYGLGNWKGFLKDKRIIKQIHKGKNQKDPSIYQKIK